jgi:hypothetical protein
MTLPQIGTGGGACATGGVDAGGWGELLRQRHRFGRSEGTTSKHLPSERRASMAKLSERDDIFDVILRYATSIDQREWSSVRSVSTDDAELDTPVRLVAVNG